MSRFLYVNSHGLPFLLGWVDSLKTLLIDLPALGANTTDVLAFLPLVLGTSSESSHHIESSQRSVSTRTAFCFSTSSYRVVVNVYVCFPGTLMCYFCSATFHLYLCHSPERFSLWSKLDYLGIVRPPSPLPSHNCPFLASPLSCLHI